MGLAFLIIYAVSLCCILIYSISQGDLTMRYLRSKKVPQKEPEQPEVWPVVTIQLPVFNERYVIERLIRKVAKMDYPSDKLEIQVLDDSTDDSLDVARTIIDEIAKEGIDIKHVLREDRSGFKAGALAYGMKVAKGEFLAVFDADFLPEKDFLKKTIPHFKDEVGAVQARWAHLNEDYSALTKLQAFGLDGHFRIEQQGRDSSNSFINFNGTAGVWRKQCIEDAGGWSSDTLTEDLDLSYRAQLAGWQFHYMEGYTAPAEIPAAIQAVKSQQYRWNKGGAENARKNLGNVLRSDLPFRVKAHAFFHLMNTSIFFFILISALCSVPLVEYLWVENIDPRILAFTFLFFFGFLILTFFYWTAFKQNHSNKFLAGLKFASIFPRFLSLSMGLSWHNTVAVAEGFLGRKTPFIRTPKFNVVKKTDSMANNRYMSFNLSSVSFVEGILALYFAYGIYMGIRLEYFSFLPFHLLLSLGFGSVFVYSIRHSLNR
ncbi:MAG: cellulose synthase/poly-beta-1,6-N-acetylglucosamine synthase-like glycosyltransferase [Granulosicoccus sp.]|jgi:cellulose synthase/poly-beta-1,6-N-acetylglucosamine synthase-like glycosyltransferase